MVLLWLSRIEFQKVPITDYLGLNSKRYLLLTIWDSISDWILNGACYWLSRIEFQEVHVTDYPGLNSKRYLLLTIWDSISDWIPRGTCYWLSRIEFQKVSVADLPWETANSPVIYFYNSPASASEASCFRVWNISSEVARSATKAASSGVQGWSTC